MGSVITQTPVDVLSADRVEPGSYPLKLATLPLLPAPKLIDANSVATEWVHSFNKAISSLDVAAVADLFLAESYWRDQLCLSWDFHCLNGRDNVVSQLKSFHDGSRLKSLALDKSSKLRSPTASVFGADGKVHTVQAFLKVETDIGNGAGIVRLVQEQGSWKVFTLFTFLAELNGHEEMVGKKRPFGVQHGEHASRKNWLDRRKAEENFEEEQEPTVLILGK